MSEGQIIKTGIVSAGATVTITERSSSWMVMQHGTSQELILTFDDQYVVHLTKELTTYTEIYGNYQKVATSGDGEFHYIVFG